MRDGCSSSEAESRFPVSKVGVKLVDAEGSALGGKKDFVDGPTPDRNRDIDTAN